MRFAELGGNYFGYDNSNVQVNHLLDLDTIEEDKIMNYGVKEFEFYTVLFGMSRIMGFTAGLVWDRAIGKPIERPKSITTKRLEDFVESEQNE